MGDFFAPKTFAPKNLDYLKSLAKAFINNEINPNKWSNYSDEEIISELIKIKGEW